MTQAIVVGVAFVLLVIAGVVVIALLLAPLEDEEPYDWSEHLYMPDEESAE